MIYAEQLKTDLLSLPASRELDALVAEKVMGCATLDRGQLHPFCRCSPALHNSEDGFLAPYSTSIAAAWEVVEHFTTTLKCAEFNVWHTLSGWYAGETDGRMWAHADTAPLAICRAALKAVGAKSS